MLFLQTDIGLFESLTQYGTLGVITIGLGAVVWYFLKRQFESETELKKQVQDLQKEINQYIREDQSKVTQAIENNTETIKELKNIIFNKNE